MVEEVISDFVEHVRVFRGEVAAPYLIYTLLQLRNLLIEVLRVVTVQREAIFK